MTTTTTLPARHIARIIASQLVNVPDAHAGGQYVFDAQDGSGGEWYNSETILPPSVVVAPAHQHNWDGWDHDEVLEAINQRYDLEGRVAEARAALGYQQQTS